MSDSELFVLANDINFIPVNTIHERAKSSFEHDEKDVVLTHMHTRKSSKVLHHEAAALLKEFETPKSWAEVILNYSLANEKDPQQLAEEAIELLVEMKEQGFLVSYMEGKQSASEALFKINDRFKQYIIKGKLQFFDDSEVYKVEDESGNKFAFKLLKSESDKNISFMFKNEIEILKKLDGKINPALIEEGIEPGFVYLITEWCHGVGCETKANRLRNLAIRNNVISMLDLCISIVRAYDYLHKQGVLHSDIYPKNILISQSGVCKIIDFGISMSTAADKRKMRAGGMYFYYEPEHTAAIVQEKTPPPLTEKAEQYSIAAVLYYLISGYHYLNFSIEREKLFHQILYDAPVSFNEYDLNLPPELDNIFSTALAKDPEKRFASLTEFANAIIEARNSIYSNSSFFIIGKENAASQFAEFITRKFGWDSTFIRKGISLSPNCSVNYGSAGIAYMFYRMACVREETKLLDIADVWANRAAEYISDYDRAFYSPEMAFTEKSIGKCSIYHSETGVHLVQTLINLSRGDNYSVNKTIQQFLIAAEKSCDKIDVTLGKSGLLIGCSIFLNELNKKDAFNFKSVTTFANNILKELWNELDQHPDLNKKNEINYFGIAHGWAGILYASLLWCFISGEKLPENFMKRVEELQKIFSFDSEIIRLPLSVSDKSSWTGWCNGNAGHIFLWTLLYKYFKEEKYLLIATKIASSLNANTENRINNLCCGMAGEAYSFLNLYNLTKEKKYLINSEKITQRIMNQISLSSLRSNSLYKGDIGLALLFCEIGKPEFAQMPLFEIRKS